MLSRDDADACMLDRRSFVKASLGSLPVAAFVSSAIAKQQAAAEPSGPEIIDTNVHVLDWPFRKLKYARTEALVAKLRKHRITKAWAGNFEAVLNKQLDQANQRLLEECQARGDGTLVPFGSINPTWP